ncbi:hypothetical protein J27TS7_28200 [Paenibacillus dendritiformis]|nr:hypothetical protein J27TS7_28200 [Paenibacillus dendritiformis]
MDKKGQTFQTYGEEFKPDGLERPTTLVRDKEHPHEVRYDR